MGKRAKSIAGKEMQKLFKFAKALDKMNEEWLHELGEQVLEEADKLVPKASGQLHDSQKVEPTKDGFKIIVDTPYAYALHEGKKQEGQKQGIHKSKIKGLWRNSTESRKFTGGYTEKGDVMRKRLNKMNRMWANIDAISKGVPKPTAVPEATVPGLIKIKAHTKKYKKGYKPTLMPDGNWATINVNKKPKKQAWLQEAWKIVRKKQDPVTRKLLQKSLYIEK